MQNIKIKPVSKLQMTYLENIVSSRYFVLIANWLMQGMRYMNCYELIIKFMLELSFIALFYFLFLEKINGLTVFLILILAHTCNWLVNGHFFALMRYIYPISRYREKFDSYLSNLEASTKNLEFIEGVAIYGSYCRGAWHSYSDLDVRVIVKNDWLSGIKGALFCFWLRLAAFFKLFPLDVYCYTNVVCLKQLSIDELPVILKDVNAKISSFYKQKK